MCPAKTHPPTVSENQGLTPAQVELWHKNGYLIIPDALDGETLVSLLGTTKQMLADFSLDDHPFTKFTAGEGMKDMSDDYFLSSGDKIRFFFEEGKPSWPLCLMISRKPRSGSIDTPPDAFDEQGTLFKPKEL